MGAHVAEQLRAVSAARTALVAESLSAQPNPSALAQRADALAQAEQNLATARADFYGRIQRSVARLSPQQAMTLAAQLATAAATGGGPPGGGGGGGRGGGAVDYAARARGAILESPHLDQKYTVFVQEAERNAGNTSIAADSILLSLAARKVGSDVPRQAAAASIDRGWNNPRRKLQIISAAVAARDTSRALAIADSVNDADLAVAETARAAVQTLGINAEELRAEARAPKLGTMQVDAVLNGVVSTRGAVGRGQQLISELGCTACHTVSANDPPKGPFLGGIAGIMSRRQMAEAILQPNRSIAQGFATYQIQLRDGSSVTGFIVREAADAVTLRDLAAVETRVPTANIVRRTALPTSLMPEGLTSGITIKEFASMLDYLESLSK
jgi:putative heme-binding domain-containing protein